MKPDHVSLEHLKYLQKQLPAQQGGFAQPERALHMTLIHFGKVRDVFTVITNLTSIPFEDYVRQLEWYIQETIKILPAQSFELTPLQLSGFGLQGRTLVAEYEAPPALHDVHDELYTVLKKFLAVCGISDVEAFMKNDRNFMHAQNLKAHITLYKGFGGSIPDLTLLPITVEAMKLVYPPVP